MERYCPWRQRLAGTVRIGLVALLAAPACLLGAQAQEGTAQPARAIRLSYVDGTVQLTKDGQQLAAQAVANTPLFEGTQIATGEDGRAEIQFEDGSVARLSPNSSLTLQTLRGAGAGGDAEIAVDSGLLYFELQESSQSGQMRIHIGDAQVTAAGFTILRVSMDQPPGALAVFSGNAHVERGGAMQVDMRGGENLTFDPSDPSRYNLAESYPTDSWDTWNSDRDEALNAEASQQTIADSSMNNGSSNPAWNDLDANGSWYNVPGQGYVWSPYEASNPSFDPYANGGWMWMPNYGYIWVSGYSWGYLPFQCGMWNYYDGFGWGWAPGIGGFSPWWSSGFYGGPYMGNVPAGYSPVLRPFQHHLVGSSRQTFIPVRRTPIPLAASLQSRNRATPVQISGATVHPLPMIAARRVYNRSTWNNVSSVQTAHTPEPVVTGSRYSNAWRQNQASGPRMTGAPAVPGTLRQSPLYAPPQTSIYTLPPSRAYAPAPSRSTARGSYSGTPRSSGGGLSGGFSGGSRSSGGGLSGGGARSGR